MVAGTASLKTNGQNRVTTGGIAPPLPSNAPLQATRIPVAERTMAPVKPGCGNDVESRLARDARFSGAVKNGLKGDDFGQRVHAAFRECMGDTVAAGVPVEVVCKHLGVSTKAMYKLRSQSHNKLPTMILFWRLVNLGSPVPEEVKAKTVAKLMSLVGFTPASGRLGGDVVTETLRVGQKAGELQRVVMDAKCPRSELGETVSPAEASRIAAAADHVVRAAAGVGGAVGGAR